MVWTADLPDIAATHLHPGDVPGAIVSLDWAVPEHRGGGRARRGRGGFPARSTLPDTPAGRLPRVMTRRGRAGQAWLMTLEGLSGLVNRIIAWADRLQRQHGVLGFPYAVVKKYGDDEGGRQAALITYYGFLSIFPLLLLGVAILSRVLAGHPGLRERLIAEIVPEALRSTVEHSLTALPTSAVPFVVGLIGLLFAGTGVVFSAYQTLNNVAAVRRRFRAGFFSRYVRVFVVLAMLMLGALAAGALTVVATALPGQPGVQRAAAVLGSALVIFAVLLLGAKLLLTRHAPVRALWPGAILGAVAVTIVLNAGPLLLARLVAKAGPVYGSFATVAGMFALLYLVGQALVYAAEVAAVRYARLWPRALDLNHPTAADSRVLGLLAREQERIPAARIEFHLAERDSPAVLGGSPPASDGPG
ncbi:MAG TPA: YhjD/YihY/BrkB family envelope integrity protein [Streptosporangiaceae bacterium]|nr:YhjD/YihY/BrkB family envelope integrity protein [Streptosporangiaceae bacterium]